jgi:uncharacterized membrane protein
VIWAIGVSMIILGLVVLLPRPIILLLGLIIVFGHNLLDNPQIAAGVKGVLFLILHISGFSVFIRFLGAEALSSFIHFFPGRVL